VRLASGTVWRPRERLPDQPGAGQAHEEAGAKDEPDGGSKAGATPWQALEAFQAARVLPRGPWALPALPRTIECKAQRLPRSFLTGFQAYRRPRCADRLEGFAVQQHCMWAKRE
jgi:hypothetical protein